MFLIEANTLTKQYDSKIALENVSFRLPEHKTLGLLGPNGAGKSTLIHILLGLLQPSVGQARVLGMDPMRARQKIAERINFSSAFVQMPGNLKVRENLGIFAKLYAVANPKKKIQELLSLFAIADIQERLTGALSSGEKTRLNLCKSLLNDPLLLLLDEPTASLDPEVADTVRKVLKSYQRRTGMSILYTSHNMPEVEDLCDSILFIHQGRVIAEGTASEITTMFQSKNLDEVFIKVVRGT